MPRVDDIFASLRASGRRGLMPFVCGGYPCPGATGPALLALQDAGACIAEVGIPFSDPIADGPVIAAAMHEALAAGATPWGVLREVEAVRPRLSMGVVAMVSVSIVHRAGGPAAFVRRAVAAGFDGFIFPDIPVEEAAEHFAAARDAGASVSPLIAPTTTPQRAAAAAAAARGFLYLLAQAGITGERDAAPDVGGRVAALRAVTSLPIACGFGISTPEHVRAVVRHADAAIVGSALVRRMGEAARAGSDPAGAAGDFLRALAAGLEAR